MTKAAKKITDNYEIVFVNDGSPDDSLRKVVELYEKDKHLKVIDLSRNFGHHKAMMTGLRQTKGDFVFLIDSDLEEDPELLGDFWGKLQKDTSLDVVYGVQESRKGGRFERWSGDAFYWLFNKLSDITLPRNVVTARLTTKRYNDALVQHTEQEMFMAGLWVITGFKQAPQVVHKATHSETTYSIRHKFGLLLNFVTSFSNFPLKLVLYTGFSISLFAAIFIGIIVFNKFFFGVAIEGWSSLIASVWFLGGMILFSVGTVGLYISKIFLETKRRPYTIIKDIYE